ncbi:MAG: hypothetical protein ABJ215_13020 [Alphaproteobacteria bacterium]
MDLRSRIRQFALSAGILVLAGCNTDGVSPGQVVRNADSGDKVDLRALKAGIWISTRKQQCRVWIPGDTSSSGTNAEWAGACATRSDGTRIVSGPGSLVWTHDGRLRGIFEGRMVDGKREGDATVEYFDISGQVAGTYKGSFHDGERHGHGVTETIRPRIAASRYEGAFADGLREGHGKLALTYHVTPEGILQRPGITYTGAFRANRPHGAGIMAFPSGDRIEGDFESGAPVGNVLYIWKNGDRFVGPTRAGKPHGEGTFTPEGGPAESATFSDGARAG